MAQTTITITVFTVNLLSGSGTAECCNISQVGNGSLTPDPNDPTNPELAISVVWKEDDITWSGVAHPVDPPNPPPIINITKMEINGNTHPFGTPLPGSSPGGGSTVTRAAKNLMENPLPYTIFFNISGIDTEYRLDPKIRVMPHPPSDA